MKKKRILVIVAISIVVLGLLVWRLAENKKVINQKAEIAISSEQFDVIPVKTVIAQTRTFNNELRLSGVFVARQDLKVSAEALGQIVQMNVKKGDYVQKGKVLARIDASSVSSQLAEAHAQLEKARRDAERYANAAEAGGVSKMQAEQYQIQVKSAESNMISVQQQLKNYTITAPVSGIINNLYVEQGSVVSPGMQMFELVDITTVRLQLKVDQAELVKHVRLSKHVGVTTEVYPGKVFPGKVESVGVKADESQKFDVEVAVQNNRETPLLVGMYGDGIFKGDTTGKPVLTIPRAAVIGSLKEASVFVVKSDSTVTQKSITVGQTIGDDVVILEGIVPGEQIVVNGQINLSEGKKVSINK